MNPLLGLLNIPHIFKEVINGKNAGAITVTGALTDIAGSAIGVSVAGDLVIALFHVRITKGAVAGSLKLQIAQSAGGGSINPASGSPVAVVGHERASVAIGEEVIVTVAGVFQVFTPGSMNLVLQGISAGSNSTVAIGDCGFTLLHFAA